MTKAVKSDLQKVLKLIVASAERGLSHLPPKEAAAVRKKIRRIAAAASRSRKEISKPGQTRASAVSPRSRA